MKTQNLSQSACLAAAIVTLACAGSVNANTITAVIGGQAQSGATYQNFDSLTPGQSGAFPLGSVSVILNPNAVVVQNSPSSSPANPYVSGNNNVNFGAAYTGGDHTPYLTAGDTGHNGSITFNFATAANYFGLLWGSVDAQNTLNFYSGPNGGGPLVATVTGSDIAGINPTIIQTGYGDSFDPWGTAYVNIDTTVAFESVVATSALYTFEIDNVAYQNVGGVPDGGTTVGLLGIGLAGLVSLRRLFARA